VPTSPEALSRNFMGIACNSPACGDVAGEI